MKLNTIKSKVEELKYPGGIKGLAEAVGMTEQNLHRCVRENKIQAQDLENIAKALNVSILCFFDDIASEGRTKNLSIEEKRKMLNNKIMRNRVIAGDHNQINETGAHDNINGNDTLGLQQQLKALMDKIEEKDKWIKEKDDRIREKDERIAELKERVSELKNK